jgi:hypothetical protein
VAAVLEELLEIVAVSVTLAPTSTEVADGESVTVLVVVPASGSQNPAQPEIAGMLAASTARRIRLHFLLPGVFDLIVCLFSCSRGVLQLEVDKLDGKICIELTIFSPGEMRAILYGPSIGRSTSIDGDTTTKARERLIKLTRELPGP